MVRLDPNYLKPVGSVSSAGKMSATSASGLSSAIKVDKNQAKGSGINKMSKGKEPDPEETYRMMLSGKQGLTQMADFNIDKGRHKELCSSPRQQFSWEELVNPTIAVPEEDAPVNARQTMAALGLLSANRKHKPAEKPVKEGADREQLQGADMGSAAKAQGGAAADMIPDRVYVPPQTAPAGGSVGLGIKGYDPSEFSADKYKLRNPLSSFQAVGRNMASPFQMRLGATVPDEKFVSVSNPPIGHYEPKHGLIFRREKTCDFVERPATVSRLGSGTGGLETVELEGASREVSRQEASRAASAPEAKKEGEEGEGGEEDVPGGATSGPKKKGKDEPRVDPTAGTSAFKSKTKSCLEMERGVHVKLTEAPDVMYSGYSERLVTRSPTSFRMDRMTSRPDPGMDAGDRVYNVVDSLADPFPIYRRSPSPGPSLRTVASRDQRAKAYSMDDAVEDAKHRVYEPVEDQLSAHQRPVAYDFSKWHSRDDHPTFQKARAAFDKDYEHLHADAKLRPRPITLLNISKQTDRKSMEHEMMDKFYDTTEAYIKTNMYRPIDGKVKFANMRAHDDLYRKEPPNTYLSYPKARRQFYRTVRKVSEKYTNMGMDISRETRRSLHEKHAPRLMDKSYPVKYGLQDRKVKGDPMIRAQITRHQRNKGRPQTAPVQFMEPLIEYKPNEDYAKAEDPVPTFDQYQDRTKRPASIRDDNKYPYPLVPRKQIYQTEVYYYQDPTIKSSPSYTIHDPTKKKPKQRLQKKKVQYGGI